jgi:hypothetical protein
MMFWDLLGGYAGALAYAFIVYNVIYAIINFITRYKILKIGLIIRSFIFSVLLTAILAEILYDWGMVLVYHFPMLIFVFWLDYRRAMYQKCPHCAERIKADALKCKHCHSIINGQEDTKNLNI